MPKEYDDRHPDIDRYSLRQEAIRRYIMLKRLEKSELNIDDEIFLENFEVVISYKCWEFLGYRRMASLDKIVI
jgi:hypothetical protein